MRSRIHVRALLALAALLTPLMVGGCGHDPFDKGVTTYYRLQPSTDQPAPNPTTDQPKEARP